MTAVQNVLNLHNQSGGTYTVMTPSYIFTNGILLRMSDASRGDSKQVQVTWQLDFTFPLLTLNQVQNAQNS